MLWPLCEGASGWKSPAGDGESVVAGTHACSDKGGNGSPVQLGASLAAGIKRQGRVDRHGNPFVPVTVPEFRNPDDVQLSGRTTCDQVVVFDGPASLAGSIVPVRVREAHGMTIFAERAERHRSAATADAVGATA